VAGFEPLGDSAAPRSDELVPGRRPGFGAILAWVLAALVILVAGVLVLRSRSSTSSGTSAPAPTAAPTPAEVAVPSPAPAPTSVPRAEASPVVVAAPAQAPTSAAKARPTRPAVSAAKEPTTVPPVREASASASSGSRPEWLARAARDRKRLAGEASTRYAIQLELACEVPSLTEAWKHDRPAGTMWVLTTRHGARDCFRVLWGRYPTLDAAKRAKGGIPAFFTTSSNRPAVVSVR